MRHIGFSVYPAHTSLEQNFAYIDLANKYHFKRVFTCLLSVSGEREKIMDEFKKTIARANEYGMNVIADINPEVFRYLGVAITIYACSRTWGFMASGLTTAFLAWKNLPCLLMCMVSKSN